jgi:hypothetical protein
MTFADIYSLLNKTVGGTEWIKWQKAMCGYYGTNIGGMLHPDWFYDYEFTIREVEFTDEEREEVERDTCQGAIKWTLVEVDVPTIFVEFNTSSPFAMELCNFEFDECDEDDDEIMEDAPIEDVKEKTMMNIGRQSFQLEEETTPSRTTFQLETPINSRENFQLTLPADSITTITVNKKRCGICREMGHNRATCKKEENPLRFFYKNPNAVSALDGYVPPTDSDSDCSLTE